MKTYDQMKDSGYPWMGKIPSHWRDINPKALFAQRKDRAKAGERQLTASQQYGVLYQDEYMALTGSRVVVVQKDFDILKHVEAGDFVISMRSFQGGLEYSPVSGSISSAYVMLIPNKKLVYPPFYRWLLKSSAYIRALQSTTDLVRDGQAMRYSNFAKVRLLVAPLEEQKAIAEYLDDRVASIDSVIEEAKSSVEKYKKWKSSVIFEAITKGLESGVETKSSGIEWIGEIPCTSRIIRLRYLVKDYKAGPFGSSLITDKLLDDGEILVYTPEHVANKSAIAEKNLYLPKSRAEEMSQFFVKSGDIIFPIVGSLGRAMMISDGMPQGIINQRLAKFSLNGYAVDPSYFMWVFGKSTFFTPYIEVNRRGSFIVNLTKAIVYDMPFVVPNDLVEQQKIAKFLDEKCGEIDSMIAEKESVIESLDNYKKSLIYETVTGKRKVV